MMSHERRMVFEDIECLMLLRFQDAHKAGDREELARLGSAIEVLREIGDSL